MLTDSSSAILIGTGLAVATFGSEDLACIGAGTLVAAGQIGLATAVIGCFAGILIGDLLLFLAGRQLGRRALATRFVDRLVSREALAHANTWLRRRGPAVILTTRFVPGTRVATYLAAGALQADARPFVLWFTIAAALWTPLLVGSATLLGANLVEAALASGRSMLTWLVAILALVGFALRLVPLIASWRGRRLLLGFWRRLTRWEFWPPWIFYPPVLGYLAY